MPSEQPAPGGDDDPLLFAAEVCDLVERETGRRILPGTFLAYVQRGQPKAHPAPRPLDEDSVVEYRNVRPRWRESAIRAWLAGRPTQGWRRGKRTPTGPTEPDETRPNG